MPQQIQELINKIKAEGVEAAEQQARDIEQQAREKADKILDKARAEAERIVAAAQENAKKTEDKTRTVLKQAARDMLLSLHEELEDTLSKIIAADVGHALTPEHLFKLIEQIAQHFLKDSKGGGIKVSLAPHDLNKLKEGFLGKLKERIKDHPVEFQASGNIHKGFIISFDKGKSGFEFSDSSLAEYLSASVNPEIASLLKEAGALSKK